MVHVLSSRVLLRPTDPDRSRAFYGRTLGLEIAREFGTGPERGTVYFLGGGGFVGGGGGAAAGAPPPPPPPPPRPPPRARGRPPRGG
ncbi:VOC family protein, partial [Streptomyces qinglanensis]|uniref:VOC family protein n=1 Tax=Streptomyces qinglanensis TaxID=943816 RepID=UPI0037908392